MSRTKITFEVVKKIVEELEAEGKPITVRSVREKNGNQGSFETISKCLVRMGRKSPSRNCAKNKIKRGLDVANIHCQSIQLEVNMTVRFEFAVGT